MNPDSFDVALLDPFARVAFQILSSPWRDPHTSEQGHGSVSRPLRGSRGFMWKPVLNGETVTGEIEVRP
jgi:hypothetical protein